MVTHYAMCDVTLVAQQKKETRLFQERSTLKKICKRTYITVFNDLLNETIKFFVSYAL